jgi:hypothetical protein
MPDEWEHASIHLRRMEACHPGTKALPNRNPNIIRELSPELCALRSSDAVFPDSFSAAGAFPPEVSIFT